ncbi:Bro-N domain-containing protein [Kitasatospora sp. NPDC056731]|uniref:BRO-N domain-containing protein n=1 Tax=Kitasatospora sp. NPDC056731 TaxID=3155422 RepID=UPI003446DB8E
MDDEQQQMTLVRSSFPVTGQPIRVVMIDGQPWFAVADVCRVLGRRNPTDAVKGLEPHQHSTVDLRSVTIAQGDGYGVSTGQKPYRQGNPLLGVVSEAGLYSLLMRSEKRSARPFRTWVTDELIPSVRRGDTDIPIQQRRMAETLAEAIGQNVRIVAEIDHENWPGLTVHSDGTVHCRHGEMVLHLPTREEDSGPPFGAYFACPGEERVGIRASRIVPGCPNLKLVDLIRMRNAAQQKSPPDDGLMHAELHGARIYGTPPQMAEMLREYGR